MLTALHHI